MGFEWSIEVSRSTRYIKLAIDQTNFTDQLQIFIEVLAS